MKKPHPKVAIIEIDKPKSRKQYFLEDISDISKGLLFLAIILLFLYLSTLFYDDIFYKYYDLPDGSLLKVSKITKTIYVKPSFMDRYVFSIDKNRIVYLLLDDFEPTLLSDPFFKLQYARIAPLIWAKIDY